MRKSISLVISAVIVLFVCLLVGGYFSDKSKEQTNEAVWVGTWAAAPQDTPDKFMPRTILDSTTIRQVVRVSIGGSQLRLQLSNLYGDGPLRVHDVYIADALDSCLIDTSTVRYLTFNGKSSVEIAAESEVFSDAVDFHLKPLQKLSVTINYEESPKAVTCHNGSFSTSYIQRGKATIETDFSQAERQHHWYNLMAVDVKRTDVSCIAILGNSITDGHGATMDAFSTWPDILAEQLDGDSLGVLNLGIGANCVVLSRGLGKPAIERFDRDILNQRGVRTIVVFQGVNDIGAMKGDTTQCEQTVMNLISAYRNFISKAHEQGVKIMGATITPFGHSKYYKPGHEQVRREVNAYIRESGEFDGVIDFDSIIRNPEEKISLSPDYHCGDWLHPNDAGYKVMGEYASKILLLQDKH